MCGFETRKQSLISFTPIHQEEEEQEQATPRGQIPASCNAQTHVRLSRAALCRVHSCRSEIQCKKCKERRRVCVRVAHFFAQAWTTSERRERDVPETHTHSITAKDGGKDKSLFSLGPSTKARQFCSCLQFCKKKAQRCPKL